MIEMFRTDYHENRGILIRRTLLLISCIVFVLAFAGLGSAATLTVNASGGADYIRIQDAINNASAGDTIIVFSGTYYENVNVNKRLILQGTYGSGAPVIYGGKSGNVITLSADGIILDGFRVTNGRNGIVVASSNNSIRNSTVELNLVYYCCGTWGSGNGYNVYFINSNNNIFINNTVQNYNSDWWSAGNGYGIGVDSSNNNTFINNIIQNNRGGPHAVCSEGLGYGTSLVNSNNNSFINNTIQGNMGRQYNYCPGGNAYGIFLSGSTNNIFMNNTIQGTVANHGSSYGIYLDNSNSNQVHNNYFNNYNNFGISISTNKWNTTKTAGVDIVGGPYIGGNFWANPSGTGYSQTCTDADWDGICDLPYTLGTDTDYLPLSMNYTVAPAGGSTGSPLPDNTVAVNAGGSPVVPAGYGKYRSEAIDVGENVTFIAVNPAGTGKVEQARIYTTYSVDGTAWANWTLATRNADGLYSVASGQYGRYFGYTIIAPPGVVVIQVIIDYVVSPNGTVYID